MFISIGKTFPFVITEPSNNGSGKNGNDDNGNLTLKVKTFYDEITDFLYNQQNSDFFQNAIHLEFRLCKSDC